MITEFDGKDFNGMMNIKVQMAMIMAPPAAASAVARAARLLV